MEQILNDLRDYVKTNLPAKLDEQTALRSDDIALPMPSDECLSIHLLDTVPATPYIDFIGMSRRPVDEYQQGCRDYEYSVRCIITVMESSQERADKASWRYARALHNVFLKDQDDRTVGYKTETQEMEFGKPVNNAGEGYTKECAVPVLITRREF